MINSAKQSRITQKAWIASSLALLAMAMYPDLAEIDQSYYGG
jgi:hypothetical protein